MPHRATRAAKAGGVTKSGRRPRRPGRTLGQRAAVHDVARIPADDDLGRAARRRSASWRAGATSASPRPRRRARRRPTAAATTPPARTAKPAAPRALAAAASGSRPAGTGLGGVVRTCSTTASASARHSVQSSQCSRCSSSAARSTSPASPSAAMEIHSRAISQSGGSWIAGGGVRSWACGEQGEVDVEYRMGASSNQHGRDRRGKVCTQQRNRAKSASAEALVEAPEGRAAGIAGEPCDASDALRDRALAGVCGSASASGMKIAAGSP